MTSPTLSSPSQQLLTFDQADSRRPHMPITNVESRPQDERYTLPFTIPQRSLRGAASRSRESDECQRDDPMETEEDIIIGEWRNENDTFGGRREVQSDSSDYEPSSSPSSSPGAGMPEEIEEEGERSINSNNHDGREGEEGEESSSSSGRSMEDGDFAAGYRASRKRSHQHNASAPLADAEASPRPGRRKRLRSSINMSYLGLLEDDMDDARRQYVPHSWSELGATQAGLSIWTAEEKEILFEAVSRLGRDDLPGISARLLGSKSEIEVHQYLDLLQKDAERRRNELRAPLHKPLLSDFLAAAEISEACCDALENAADLIAQREDHQEAQDEGRKWGPHWLLTGDNCRRLSKAALKIAGMPNEEDATNQLPVPSEDHRNDRIAIIGAQLRPNAVPPLALFHVRNMLLLSERVFMNGVNEDAHYLGLGDTLPAAHMSALHNLYELVYSLTQRAAATAIHVCQSRYRLDPRLASKKKRQVHRRDVHAAVASLGLERNSHHFWARCPRRLGLKVARSALPFVGMESASQVEVPEETFPRKDGSGSRGSEADDQSNDEDEDRDDDDDDDGDIMTYDEAERELLPQNAKIVTNLRPEPSPQVMNWQYEASYVDEDDSNSDGGSNDESEGPDTATALNEQRIRDEANEVICYSATGYPRAAWARTSLENRIRHELKEEEYAAAVDDRASRQDELYLWAVVGREPPPALMAAVSADNRTAAPHVEGFSLSARRYPVEEVIETGRNWRDKLQYEAEWEPSAAEA
ncbi:hypothetical protein SEPCBS57363_000971 [Sporothrix epigloea]|uniref:Myb-like domain-containing protein n=1 Tax=Sporothrix epigloea TaxID=1892477 RepID=A0ABP0DA62_9PEZI